MFQRLEPHVAMLGGLVSFHDMTSTLPGLLGGLGCVGVRGYLEGNYVFHATRQTREALVAQAPSLVQSLGGGEVKLAIRSAAELGRAVKENPYARTLRSARALHVAFLGGFSSAELKTVTPLLVDCRGFSIRDREVFVHRARSGTWRSSHHLPVVRGWQTVLRLWALSRPAYGGQRVRVTRDLAG